MSLFRRACAEGIGTFALVFAGCGAVAAAVRDAGLPAEFADKLVIAA